MSHDPKLNVYKIILNKEDSAPFSSNKWLFKHKIGKGTTDKLEDNFLMAEAFRLFIKALDTPEMFTDTASRKCMTANQANI